VILYFQVKELRSLAAHLVDFLVAGVIFTAIVFAGLYTMNFRIVSDQSKSSPKELNTALAQASSKEEPIISTPLPSQEELVRQLIGANRPAKKNEPSRPLASWERQVRDIQRQAVAPAEKTRQLLALAQTLSGEEQARVYASASSTAPPSLFQQQLYPMIWNAGTPVAVARVLASGVVTQPDSFKFPALLSLMKHSDEETRAMAESVLWAYFPDEPTNNYPQAVQLFLRGSY